MSTAFDTALRSLYGLKSSLTLALQGRSDSESQDDPTSIARIMTADWNSYLRQSVANNDFVALEWMTDLLNGRNPKRFSAVFSNRSFRRMDLATYITNTSLRHGSRDAFSTLLHHHNIYGSSRPPSEDALHSARMAMFRLANIPDEESERFIRDRKQEEDDKTTTTPTS